MERQGWQTCSPDTIRNWESRYSWRWIKALMSSVRLRFNPSPEYEMSCWPSYTVGSEWLRVHDTWRQNRLADWQTHCRLSTTTTTTTTTKLGCLSWYWFWSALASWKGCWNPQENDYMHVSWYYWLCCVTLFIRVKLLHTIFIVQINRF